MGTDKNIKLHIVTDIKRVICTKMFTVQSKLFVIGLLLLLVEDGENLCRDKLEEAPWVLQQFRVCFGAKDSNFGKFYVNQNGALYALKLVYHSGNVSCYVPDPTLASHWGCKHTYVASLVGVFVTDESNQIIFPKSFGNSTDTFYKMPGYNGMSNKLAFVDFSTPMYASRGQELRIWYGEDLSDTFDHDNGGMTCADVYAKFA